MAEKFYSITEIAQKFGMTAHTLRYYDKEGLLPFVGRTASGIRRFRAADFDGLEIINCLKETGMSIKDIKTFMDWCQAGDSTIAQRLQMFQDRQIAVKKEIAELKRHLKKIEYKIWYYETALQAGTTKIHETCEK